MRRQGGGDKEEMKLLILLSLSTCMAFAQIKTPIVQQGGDCSVNISGNKNTASLICSGVDPKLAEQVRAILNGTRRSQNAAKEISEKLDLILKQMNKEANHPTVGLRFVYPKSPALVLINQSGVIAKDLKWSVSLWNLDLPDRNDPLPIPVSAFDWLRPNDEGRPENLFETPLIAPLLKAGNRLFGSASVICRNVLGVGHTLCILFGAKPAGSQRW